MTTNRFGLPEDELAAIRERDRDCVYYHVTMRPYYSDGPRTAWATIEHFNGPPYGDPTPDRHLLHRIRSCGHPR